MMEGNTQSEKVALQWEDIDFERMLINIEPAADKNGMGASCRCVRSLSDYYCQ